MGKVILVSYAGAADPSLDAQFQANQQSLIASAPTGGIDEVLAWNRGKLIATSFYLQHREILDRKRGGGYWLWKPFIILEAVKQAQSDDVVVYWDVGRARASVFTRPLAPLLRWCRDHNGIFPGVAIFPQSRWTKRDCFHLMDCDTREFWNARQIQATFSLWSGGASVEFLSQWLHWCCDRRCLTDDPNECGLSNLAGFREHRHDQSVLTNLCVRHRLAAPPTPPIPGTLWTKNINIWSDLLEAGNAASTQSEELTCQVVLKHMPAQPFANYRLGSIFLRTGRELEGIEHLRKAAEALPKAAAVHRDLGRALARRGDLRPAIAHLRRALAIPNVEDVASLFLELGNLLAQVEDAVGAEVSYRQALIADGECVEAWRRLARLLAGAERRDEAIAAMRRARHLRPGDEGIRQELVAMAARDFSSELGHTKKIVE